MVHVFVGLVGAGQAHEAEYGQVECFGRGAHVGEECAVSSTASLSSCIVNI